MGNCEHLAGAAARTAEALVRRCPGVRVLATSREMLGVAGEVPWRVPSLTAPGPRERPPLAELLRYEAVQLFVERARVVDPGFAPTERNDAALAQVCGRLDGIPLALELAAARVRVLSVEQIAARLDDRFRLLTGGRRTALRRQQTLRATVDWSHDLLSAPERARHRDWYVALGALAHERFRGPEQRRWVERLEREHDNLRAALGWCLGAADAEPGLRLATALGAFWLMHGHGREARSWLQELLALGNGAADDPRLRSARARALTAAAVFAALWGEPGVAGRLVEEAVTTLRALGEERGLPEALAGLGGWYVHQGRLAEARGVLLEARALARRTGDAAAAALVSHFLGGAAFSVGDLAGARAAVEEALALQRAAGDPDGTAIELEWLGNVALAAGDPEAARARHGESLALYREAGDRLGIAHALLGLGLAAVERGDAADAERLLRECLAIQREIGGDRPWLPVTLHGLAGGAALRVGAEGAPAAERALRLAGAASAAREQGAGFRDVLDRLMPERWLVPAFAALGGRGAPAAEAARAAGRAMTAEEAIAFALADREGESPAPPPVRRTATHDSRCLRSNGAPVRRAAFPRLRRWSLNRRERALVRA
jgi:non-specific serine/threonine protein kinase